MNDVKLNGLHRAMRLKEPLETVQSLINEGANPNQRNCIGFRVLHLAEYMLKPPS